MLSRSDLKSILECIDTYDELICCCKKCLSAQEKHANKRSLFDHLGDNMNRGLTDLKFVEDLIEPWKIEGTDGYQCKIPGCSLAHVVYMKKDMKFHAKGHFLIRNSSSSWVTNMDHAYEIKFGHRLVDEIEPEPSTQQIA